MKTNTLITKNGSAIHTIGVFIGIFGNYQDAICNGIAQAAKENNINVIFFVGAALKDGIGFRKHWNAVYDLASSSNLDGLIVFTAAIKEFVTADELTQFFAHYAPLPTISINQKLDDTPSVTIDSSTGLRDLMRHLIEDHGYKRIAFIRGPENFDQAEERYRAYQEGLASYGLPFDPDLVTPGNFMPPAGAEAVKLLLDERGVTFDAIVASNDGMAFGAWKELNQRGMVVPTDVALLGFDDVVEAKSFAVPLTTISTSLGEQGRIAVQMLAESFQTQTPPPSRVIDTALVVRESCGCLAVGSRSSGVPEVVVAGENATPVERQSRVLAEIQHLICPLFANVTPASIEPFVGAFWNGLRGDSASQFLVSFSRLLQMSSADLARSQVEDGILSRWLEVLALLHDHKHLAIAPDTAELMDTLLNQAQLTVIKTIERTHADLRNWAEADLRIQAEMVRDVNTASEMEQIGNILAQNLPEMRIRTSALVLYEGETIPPPASRLIMACFDGKRVDLAAGGRLFPTQELVPLDMLPRTRIPLLTLLPLVARDTHFGYMLMEMIPGHWSMYNGYLALAEQIGAALYGVLLQRQLKQSNDYLQNHMFELAAANVQLEKARQIAEQANQVKSWFLATMSHELRTPLNGIINFTRFVADGMLGTVNDQQTDALRRAVGNSKHLLALINDILDISKIESGSLKLFVEEDVDVIHELKEAVATAEGLLDGKSVELKVNIEANLPTIRADKRRIKQIVLNILSNACKFTDAGHILVSASRQGQDMLICVEDTGPGIAKEDQDAVFEVFTQTEAGIRQGGGTGLGMPISRRLAEAHGGALWLESEVNKGTTFYVRLPVKSAMLQTTLKEGVKDVS